MSDKQKRIAKIATLAVLVVTCVVGLAASRLSSKSDSAIEQISEQVLRHLGVDVDFSSDEN